jgi:hypothetical protein
MHAGVIQHRFLLLLSSCKKLQTPPERYPDIISLVKLVCSLPGIVETFVAWSVATQCGVM